MLVDLSYWRVTYAWPSTIQNAACFFGYDFSSGEWLSAVDVIHAWIGYAILLAFLLQVVLGVQKYCAFMKGVGSMKYHNVLGKIIIGVGCLNVIFGMVALSLPDTTVILLSALVIFNGYFGALYPFPLDFFSTASISTSARSYGATPETADEVEWEGKGAGKHWKGYESCSVEENNQSVDL